MDSESATCTGVEVSTEDTAVVADMGVGVGVGVGEGIESQWLSVPPNAITYYPYYTVQWLTIVRRNCYQDEVWNVPTSLASSPVITPSSPLLLVFLPGTGSTPHQFQKGLLDYIAWLSSHLRTTLCQHPLPCE